jgi:hypothetical protein
MAQGSEKELRMIKFDLDEVNGLLLCTMEGFLSLADVDQYAKDLHRFAEKVRKQAGRVRLLIDARQVPVLSAEVTEAFGKVPLVMSAPSDRLAIIVGTYLNRLQAKRLLEDEQEKVFQDVEEGRQWLLSDLKP